MSFIAIIIVIVLFLANERFKETKRKGQEHIICSEVPPNAPVRRRLGQDTWAAESMLDVSELFSAVALYAFQRLLVLYVGSTEGLKLQLSRSTLWG